MTRKQLFTCQLCEATSAGTAVERSKVDRTICTWCDAELARTNRRRCRKCNTVKPLPFDAQQRYVWCVSCAQAYRVDYMQRERERVNAKKRAAYAANREARAAAVRAWREENKERINAAHRARYAADPMRRRMNSKRWHNKNKERMAEKWQRYRAAHPEYAAMRGRIYRARRKLAILRGLA